MKKKLLLLLPILAVSTALALLIRMNKASRHRPNVILILVDTLRSDYLGYAGFNGNISPSLDALASRSIQFQKCVAPSPRTEPSIATLFTGHNPTAHRVGLKGVETIGNQPVLSGTFFTLAEAFKKNGYRTGGFVANPRVQAKFGFGQGFDEYYYGPRDGHEIAQKSLEWLGSGEKNDPFFLYVHFMDVHGPYHCEEEDFQKLTGSFSYKNSETLSTEELGDIPGYLEEWVPWDNSRIRNNVSFWKNCYAAGVYRMDGILGEFFTRLKETGQWDNSIIILTSDHGEEFFEHGGWDHGATLYQEQISVPLLVRLPGDRLAGKKIPIPAGLIDLPPTLAELALNDTAAFSEKYEGRSLVPFLDKIPPDLNRYFISEAAFSKTEGRLKAVQNKRHKLILKSDPRKTELYNLEKDPGEKENLFGKNPELERELLQNLGAIEKRSEQHQVNPELRALSEKEIEKLKSLGYVQ